MDGAIDDAGDSGDIDDAGADADAGEQGPCMPFEEDPCYTGPVGTEGVGACHAGTHVCNEEGTGYGPCEDEVTPQPVGCGSFDLDCNDEMDGTQDNDQDGDGFLRCVNDCCDSDEDCDDPELINPGAYDYAGDGIDNDCSDDADDATTCDGSLESDASDATDYARALDLCQLTLAAPPPSQRRWGLISVSFTRADGTGAPLSSQHSIRSAFGEIENQGGAAMTVLSTGVAAAVGDIAPAYVAPSTGVDHGTTSAAPADWLMAHSNAMQPSAPGCPVTASPPHDPVMLSISMRVPTNARAFTVDAYYLSTDYPEWVCSEVTDYFLALLTSSYDGTPENPDDRNIAAAGSTPMGVGLVRTTEMFRACVNGTTGCQPGAVASTTDDCDSSAELAGTGYETALAGQCGTDSLTGGGTGWLRFGGNVVPGETAHLRLVLWDSFDGIEDSKVLLDNFRWLTDEITPGLRVIE